MPYSKWLRPASRCSWSSIAAGSHHSMLTKGIQASRSSSLSQRGSGPGVVMGPSYMTEKVKPEMRHLTRKVIRPTIYLTDQALCWVPERGGSDHDHCQPEFRSSELRLRRSRHHG